MLFGEGPGSGAQGPPSRGPGSQLTSLGTEPLGLCLLASPEQPCPKSYQHELAILGARFYQGGICCFSEIQMELDIRNFIWQPYPRRIPQTSAPAANILEAGQTLSMSLLDR